jgi:hypothetical protein
MGKRSEQAASIGAARFTKLKNRRRVEDVPYLGGLSWRAIGKRERPQGARRPAER